MVLWRGNSVHAETIDADLPTRLDHCLWKKNYFLRTTVSLNKGRKCGTGQKIEDGLCMHVMSLFEGVPKTAEISHDSFALYSSLPVQFFLQHKFHLFLRPEGIWFIHHQITGIGTWLWIRASPNASPGRRTGSTNASCLSSNSPARAIQPTRVILSVFLGRRNSLQLFQTQFNSAKLIDFWSAKYND